MDRVRVRFAPSPTGTPHIGNIRTAMFNWLFARHHGGQFVVRIEDTDRKRLVPGSIEAILDALRWLGLNWDEGPEVGGPYGPYVQSQRLHLYHSYARQLAASGHAYYCYCTAERLDQLRAEQERRGEPTGYDRRCRYLSPAERAVAESSGVTPVVRFAVPFTGETTYRDLLRGDVTIQHSVLEDLICLKADGYPVYDFAVVVDDHLMEISHVLRADEFVSSTPRHVMLYRALGWEPPQFAHLPIILGPDRKRLSKRHGSTGVASFREEGFLPETLVNYLALLGWSYDGATQVFSREELIARFDLDHVGKTAAVFDRDKLEWMNGVYIRQLPPEELARRLYPVLQQANLLPAGPVDAVALARVSQVVPLVRERLKRLAEAPDWVDFIFKYEANYDATLLTPKGLSTEKTRESLVASRSALEALDEWHGEAIEARLRRLAEQLQLKPGSYSAPSASHLPARRWLHRCSSLWPCSDGTFP